MIIVIYYYSYHTWMAIRGVMEGVRKLPARWRNLQIHFRKSFCEPKRICRRRNFLKYDLRNLRNHGV
jgi:hypothetical protein